MFYKIGKTKKNQLTPTFSVVYISVEGGTAEQFNSRPQSGSPEIGGSTTYKMFYKIGKTKKKRINFNFLSSLHTGCIWKNWD